MLALKLGMGSDCALTSDLLAHMHVFIHQMERVFKTLRLINPLLQHIQIDKKK